MSKEVSFTAAELEKIAMLLSQSGKALKEATELGKRLLSDNEKLAAENETMKERERTAERNATIGKIAEMLNEHGLISKTAMSQKISDLNNMSDEALHQLESTIRGLNGTPAEKHASEGVFDTFAFMEQYDLSLKGDGRPGPIKL